MNDNELNRLQAAINKGWLPDDIRAAMRGNADLAQVRVEPQYDQYKPDNVVGVAIVYEVPNGDENDTNSVHRAIYDTREVKKLLKAANG